MARADYDVWLFDLDGTLIDVDPAHSRRVFDEVGSRLGREFSDREVTALWHGFGRSRNSLLQELEIDPDSFWATFHDIEDAQRRAEVSYRLH